MSLELVQTPAYVRAARALVKRDHTASAAIRSTLSLLIEDPYDPRLRIHKLKGALDGCWAASAGYDLRLIFQFVTRNGRDVIVLLTIGTHDEVY